MPRRGVLVGGQRLIMAIGGALRAAIKAGNFTSAARESRRRARALAELNASGGIGNPNRARGADDYLRSRGVDVDSMTAPGTGNPYMDWVDEDFGPTFSDNPFGGVNFYNRGNRMRFAGEGADYNLPATLPTGSRYRGPIQAPYEGFRVWPGTRLPGFGEAMQVGAVPGGTMRSMREGVPFSVGQAPPWMGRGLAPAPSTGRFLPRDMSYGGGRMYDFEMGDLQGQQFFAPSVPAPALPRYSFDDFGGEVPFVW